MSSQKIRIQQYLKQYQLRQKRKKRQDKFHLPSFKVLMSLLIVAVILYFGIQFYNAVHQPLKSVTALQTTVYDEISSSGYFVRQEKTIEQNYSGILQYVVNEGQKIAQGSLYANVYTSEDAANTTSQIKELDTRIQTLETALSYATNSSTPSSSRSSTLSSEIQSLLFRINTISDSNMLSLLKEPMEQLKSDIVNRDFAFTTVEDVEASIISLKKDRERLTSSIANQEQHLFSPTAGFFSASVDGYESVLTLASLSSLTLDEYQALGDTEPVVSENAVGKVVTDFTWYFVTVLHSEDAAKMNVGSTVHIQIDTIGEDMIAAKVNAIRRQTSGEVLVVLESDKELTQIIGLRHQSVHIILASYEGLKVPKSALRMDDEYHMGVYVITGMYAEFKQIEPVYESQEYYIVKTNPTTTKSLLVYDEIIVSGRGLENKKVIV